MSLLDVGVMRRHSARDFRRAEPFPWCNPSGLLTPAAFRALCDEFPPVERFEAHVGLDRIHGQRPHDRLYLAYESSVYHEPGTVEGPGIVGLGALAPSWQAFLRELESPRYQRWIRSLLGVAPDRIRYAWHLGFEGSEVSPHVDGKEKAATHIFYFNESADWDRAWGGETLVLGGRTVDRMNPDFNDFRSSQAVEFLDNRSFLFRNGPDAWHGVRPLAVPAGRHRRLFNVIFECDRARGRRARSRRLRWPFGRSVG